MATSAAFREILLKLCRREDLSREEAREAFLHVMSGEASEAQIGGLLVGLAAKGTTVEELVGAATVMREKAIPIDCASGERAGCRGNTTGDGSTGDKALSDDATGDRAKGHHAKGHHAKGHHARGHHARGHDATGDNSTGENVSGNDASGDVILDTCGTGGDVRGTLNISTAAAIVAAACGMKVVKHGNRSASSKSGSADVLERLGLKLEVGADVLGQCLKEANICFAFARAHHPAMKFVGAARSSLGIPTIFNLLGPLTNPGRARHQLLGVFAPELTGRLASVLRELGSERAWVVHADDGLDELSTLGPTQVSELNDGQVHTWKLDPASLGLAYARLSDLQVHSVDEAADAMREVLTGRPGPKRDIVALNAAAALVIGGRDGDLPAGLRRAVAALESGAARATLHRLIRVTSESGA